jgi:hypothetical protein
MDLRAGLYARLMKYCLEVLEKLNVNCIKLLYFPPILYGSESWTLSKAHETPLGGFERDFKKMGSRVDVIIRSYIVYLMMLI